MNSLRSFYKSTHWFWVISRIIIALTFIVSMVQIMGMGGMRYGYEVAVNCISLIGVLMLVLLAIKEIGRQPKPTWMRISAGVFLLLFGAGLLVLLAIGPVTPGLRPFLFVLTLWFLLLGLRDFVVR